MSADTNGLEIENIGVNPFVPFTWHMKLIFSCEKLLYKCFTEKMSYKYEYGLIWVYYYNRVNERCIKKKGVFKTLNKGLYKRRFLLSFL